MRLRTNIRIVRGIAAVKLAFLTALLFPALRAGGAGLLVWLMALLVLSAQQIHLLRRSENLSCPFCGHSYGPKILLHMRCPHCGQDVPENACVSPFAWIPTALLGVLIIGILIYTRPLPFPQLAQAKGPVHIRYIQELPPQIEDFVAIPQAETGEFILEPQSPAAQAIDRILSRYTYRRCLKTLWDTTSFSGLGDYQFFLAIPGSPPLELDLFGCRYLQYGDSVYQIGWFGDSAGAQLGAELAQALGLS